MSKSNTVETVSNVAKENGLMIASQNNQAAIVAAMSEKDRSLLTLAESKDSVHENRIQELKDNQSAAIKSERRIAELEAEVKHLKESQKKVVIESTGATRNGWNWVDTPRYRTITEEVPVSTSGIYTVNMEEAEHKLREELRNEFTKELQEKEDLKLEVAGLKAKNAKLKLDHESELESRQADFNRQIEENRQSYLNRSSKAELEYKEAKEEWRIRYEERRIEIEAEYKELKLELKEKYAEVMGRVKRFKNNVFVRLFGLNKVLQLA